MPRGESCSQTVRPLLPRGIFDKETRRKAVAVAGAAMELGAELACMEKAKRLEDPGWVRREGRYISQERAIS